MKRAWPGFHPGSDGLTSAQMDELSSRSNLPIFFFLP